MGVVSVLFWVSYVIIVGVLIWSFIRAYIDNNTEIISDYTVWIGGILLLIPGINHLVALCILFILMES